MSATKAEAAVSYAALILADSNISITSEKLQTLIQAAGIEDVEPIWTKLFANALKDKDITELVTAVGTSDTVAGINAQETGGDKGVENGEDDRGNEDGHDGAEESGDDLGNLFDL